MTLKTNPYTILGITDYSPMSTVKHAFKTLSAKYHPDIAGNNNDLQQKFLEITDAYNQIKSEAKELYSFIGVERESGGDVIKAAYHQKLEHVNNLSKKGDKEATKQMERLKKTYSLIVSDYIDENSNQW